MWREHLTNGENQCILQYMKNITISSDLIHAAQSTWDRVSPDAGYCTADERVELVLDRIGGPPASELTALIRVHGYNKVARAFMKII